MKTEEWKQELFQMTESNDCVRINTVIYWNCLEIISLAPALVGFTSFSCRHEDFLRSL